MKDLLEVQKQLLPDLLETMKKRYTLLRHILISGVVGRRTLAASLGFTERVLRTEVDFLKEQRLVQINASGIQISEAGRDLIERMEPVVKELFGLSEWEERIRTTFGLKQVVIVPGNADMSEHTKKELGRAGALVLKKLVKENEVIAVTGGSTLAQAADQLSEATSVMKSCWFVPARGGLGESVENQANTIAATMAQKVGARYRLLHVPDYLTEEAYQTLMQDPQIMEIVEFIRTAKVVVHGIGDAGVMAKRRKADLAFVESLQRDGALAESFGYYFDAKGSILQKMPIIGLRIEDIHGMGSVIAIAGGSSKGKAIVAVLKHGHEDVLVTDEAAAAEIIKHL